MEIYIYIYTICFINSAKEDTNYQQVKFICGGKKCVCVFSKDNKRKNSNQDAHGNRDGGN